jgi:hypothetical protein
MNIRNSFTISPFLSFDRLQLAQNTRQPKKTLRSSALLPGSYGNIAEPQRWGAPGGTVFTPWAQPSPTERQAPNGTWSYVSGAGGGALQVVVSAQLIVNGRLECDGESPATSAAGAGAGGSLWVQVAGSTTDALVPLPPLLICPHLYTHLDSVYSVYLPPQAQPAPRELA